MEPKKIGITLRVETIKKYNEKRDAISQDWINILKELDFLPVLIPNSLNDVYGFLKAMKLDGLILSGGDNIGDDLERDKTEESIIKFAIKNDVPIIGICRGMQVINNFFNGSVLKTNSLNHVGKRHSIKIIDKKFEEIFFNHMDVNSYHENIINEKIIGENLQIFAIDERDNTIEGFYHKDFTIYGIMWHPERENSYKNGLKLFKFFYNQNHM